MKAFKGFVIVNNNGYHYEGMQYSRKSKYGIEGGKIAKLTIKCKGKVVASYDRLGTLSRATPNSVMPSTSSHSTTTREVRNGNDQDLPEMRKDLHGATCDFKV